MPVEVKVGPPVLTINQGSMFMVTDQRGEIDSDSELGFFADGTRLISFYRENGSDRAELVRTRTMLSNQLTSYLKAYFPAFLDLYDWSHAQVATDPGRCTLLFTRRAPYTMSRRMRPLFAISTNSK